MKAFGEGQRHWAGIVAIATLFVLALAAPLMLDGPAGSGAIQTSVVQAATRDRFEITDPLRLLALPAITIERGTISFRHASGSRLSSAEAMLAVLRGGTGALVIEDATLALGDNALPPPPDTFDALAAPIVEALSKLAFTSVKLARCRLVLADRAGAPIVLEDLEATFSLARRTARTARGSFLFRGEAVAFDLTLGAETEESGKAPLAGSIKGRHVAAELRGLLQLDALTLSAPQASLDIPDLRRAVRWLGASWPDGSVVSSLSLRGELEWSRRTIAFQNATIRIDDNEAKGGLALKTMGPRPAIDGTMAFSRLDLAPFVRNSPVSEHKFSLSRLITWPDWIEPAPLQLAEQVDADLRLSSDVVTFGAHRLGRGAAMLSLEQGRLLADVTELELGSGARGSGQLSIDFAPSAPPIAVKAKLEQVDLSQLSERLFGHPALHGRSDLAIDLAGAGSTSSDVVGSARGRMLVRTEKGAQLGADLRMLAATALSKELDGWGPAGKGHTTVDQLDAELTLSNGVLAFQNATAKAGATTLKAAGWIGLGDASINLRLAVSRPADQSALPEDAKDKAAAVNSSLIQIEGPWSKPRIRHVPASNRAAQPPDEQPQPSGKRG
jgi:hypothetical protein